MEIIVGGEDESESIVQLGPIPSTRTKVQFGPKRNTKVALNHHPPPKTFKVVPGNHIVNAT